MAVADKLLICPAGVSVVARRSPRPWGKDVRIDLKNFRAGGGEWSSRSLQVAHLCWGAAGSRCPWRASAHWLAA